MLGLGLLGRGLGWLVERGNRMDELCERNVLGNDLLLTQRDGALGRDKIDGLELENGWTSIN